MTVEEGSSLGGLRAKPNAPSHYSRDLGQPRETATAAGRDFDTGSGSPHLLDPLGEEVKRTLRRYDQAHEQF